MGSKKQEKSTSKPPKPPTSQQIRAIIDKNNLQALKQLLKQCPSMFESQSPNYLKICCLSNKPALISLLLDCFHADYTKKFISDTLIQCIRFEKKQIVYTFIEKGFAIDKVLLQKKGIKFKCIDFAILGGHYQIAQYVYQRLDVQNRNLRNYKQYELLGKQYQYRYVNYQMFIHGIINNLTSQQAGNYLKKELSAKRKQEIRRIYEENCWDWLKRVLGFAKVNKRNKADKTKLASSAFSRYPNPTQKANQNASNNERNPQFQDHIVSTQRNLSTKQSSKK